MSMGVTGKLHAGEYALLAGMTPGQLLEDMYRNKVVQHDFTIVAGWTFHQMLTELQHAAKLKHNSVGLDDATIMRRIGAVGVMPEGRFLAETYAYVKSDSDLDVLRRAYQAMTTTLIHCWAQRAQHLPLSTPYQALILASMVEKENTRVDEGAKIAGVFIRRLRKHMRLQSDPTVIYGMGSAYHHRLHKADLKRDTPYNTYTRYGLPPTPIALPGSASINAVLHPATGDALYFVARGDGTHAFSSTYAQHRRYVACYELKRCP